MDVMRHASTPGSQPFGRKLGHSFYQREALDLAPALIGTILVRRLGSIVRRARIVETEAYVGAHDLACHASKGRTQRTEVMFGPAGHTYVYFIYGMYHMLNIVASEIDNPQAVLIRAADPLDGWTADLSGPGKLTRAMKITRQENNLDLTGESLFLTARRRGDRPHIVRTKRIGVDYAKEWMHAELRFLDAQSPCVSKPRPSQPASFATNPAKEK
jgi:DNA-3-methyladenine glycosylase